MVAASDPGDENAPDRRDQAIERLTLWREAISSLVLIAVVLLLLVLTSTLSHA